MRTNKNKGSIISKNYWNKMRNKTLKQVNKNIKLQIRWKENKFINKIKLKDNGRIVKKIVTEVIAK